MDATKAVEFFKAPQQLVELLGERTEELLSSWFTAAGYLRPRGWYVSMFPSMAVVKKKTGAVDANLSFAMSYYMSDEEEAPSVRVGISSWLSDEISDDPFPTIDISVKSDDGEKRFLFRAGAWTEE